MKKLFKKLALMVVALLTFSVGSNYTVKEVRAENNGSWNLVTDVNELSFGDEIVITAKNANYAMSTTQNTNNRAQVAVTKVGSTLTCSSEVQVLILEEGTVDGTFAFNTGSGYLYAASSKSNHLKTQGTLNDNGSWLISITSEGIATIKAQGTNTRNWMRYNSSNNPPIFSCYSSGQTNISLYKKVSEVIENTTEDKIKANDTQAYLGFDYTLTYGMVTIPGASSLVTDATALNVGDQIIIAAFESEVAMSTTQNGNNRGQSTITKNTDETIEFDNTVQVLTLEAGTKDGTFAFNTGSGYLYAASSSSNYLRTGEKNDNASWKIVISDTGIATITAQGSNTRNILRYNSNNSIFSCYSSGQLDVCIYKATGEKEVEDIISSTFDNISILFGATLDSSLFEEYDEVTGGVYLCAGETFDKSLAIKKSVAIDSKNGYSVGVVLNVIEDNITVDSSTKSRLSEKITAAVFFEVDGNELILMSKTVSVSSMVDTYLSDEYSSYQEIIDNRKALEKLQALIKAA